jgi:ppGpp synthetase/RelA/SpoT-type nucleotidyltranferase
VQRYSIKQVKRAGSIIAARNPYPLTDEVLAAFAVAHEWRDAHLAPMRAARAELKSLARRAGADGQTSGRLKRFQSIRRKLRRRPLSLYQMQDIAGARIIVPSADQVDAIAELYRHGLSRHEYLDEDNYIAAPKPGGYRSAHFVLKYAGDEELTGGNRLTVEVQLRTRLQHAWATAVEAVGAVRNEDLKGGEGDRDWLRFFELMSTEFALEEARPLVPTAAASSAERRAELRDLVERLDAVTTLEGYRRAISHIDDFRQLAGSAFLVEFDSVTRSVRVRSNAAYQLLAAEYRAAERTDATNAVMVEVDRVDDLVSAYPNYFLDVQMFTDRLRQAMGEPARGEPVGATSSSAWLADWIRGSRSGRLRRV